MRLPLFVFAAALVLCACASTVPATHIVRDELNGFVRVTSNGQELFCDKERRGLTLGYVCYTRDQIKQLLLARRLAAGASTAGQPIINPNMSPYTFYTASGH